MAKLSSKTSEEEKAVEDRDVDVGYFCCGCFGGNEFYSSEVLEGGFLEGCETTSTMLGVFDSKSC